MQRAFLTEAAFQSQRTLLQLGRFEPRDVPRLLMGLRNCVYTTTQHFLVTETGLVLDGLVPGSTTGQGSTSIRFALIGSAVRAAKIGNPQLLESEYAVSQAVAAAGTFPTVMCVLCKLALPLADGGVPRAALVMPPYAMSLAEAAMALPAGPSRARDALALAAAACGGAAVAAFAAAGYAHGDIKPANLMLDASGLVVAIDFGTARPLGHPFTEGSPFGLDAPREAGVSYDLACLGATLWVVQHGSPLPPRCTRATLLAALAAGDPGAAPPADQVAAFCLAPPEDVPLPRLRQLLGRLLAAGCGTGAPSWLAGDATAVALDVVWPMPAAPPAAL